MMHKVLLRPASGNSMQAQTSTQLGRQSACRPMALMHNSCVVSIDDARHTNGLSHREKRYVAFPEGSSLTTAICMTVGMIGNPSKSYLSWAINWGLAYNLPNYSWARQHAEGFANTNTSKVLIERRSRRDLYEKLILAMDNMGYDGRACLSRVLCETGTFMRHFGHRKGNMIEEIVKTIFSFPSTGMVDHEPTEHHYYEKIFHRSKRFDIDCSAQYKTCEFSLLDLILGHHTLPSSQYSIDYKFL